MDIRVQSSADDQRVDVLVKAAFGPDHDMRAVWRLRVGKAVAALCLVASDYRQIVGSLRFWEILVAGQPQLLLGPLAVLPEVQGKGFGRALVSDGLRRAEQMRRWRHVFLSGDLDYYDRFGFVKTEAGRFIWPGPLVPNELLIRQLKWQRQDDLPPGPLALLPQMISDNQDQNKKAI